MLQMSTTVREGGVLSFKVQVLGFGLNLTLELVLPLLHIKTQVYFINIVVVQKLGCAYD